MEYNGYTIYVSNIKQIVKNRGLLFDVDTNGKITIIGNGKLIELKSNSIEKLKPKIYYSNKNSLIEVEDPTNKIIIKGTYKLEIRFKHPCVFDIEELRGSNLPYEEHINIIVMIHSNTNISYFKQCIKSIALQSNKNWICTLIYDGTDEININQLVQPYGDIAKKFMSIKFNWVGIAKCMIYAISNSAYPLVFLDPHDILNSSFVHEILNILNRNHHVFIRLTSVMYDKDLKHQLTNGKPICIFYSHQYYLTEGINMNYNYGGHDIYLYNLLKSCIDEHICDKPVYIHRTGVYKAISEYPLYKYYTNRANLLDSKSELLTVNDVFDHIYILNLKRDTDKKHRLEQIFKRLNIKATFFEATLGSEHKTEFERIKALHSSYRFPNQYGYTKTMIDILLNAKANNYTQILVFDDDVIFHKDFINLFDKNFRQIPTNWDVLFFGLTGTWHTPNINLELRSFNYDKCYISDLTDCDGSYAVGYKNTVYDDIIRSVMKFEHPFDTDIIKCFNKHHNYKMYAFVPYLVIANMIESSIEQRNKNVETNYMSYYAKFHINLQSYEMDTLIDNCYNKLYERKKITKIIFDPRKYKPDPNIEYILVYQFKPRNLDIKTVSSIDDALASACGQEILLSSDDRKNLKIERQSHIKSTEININKYDTTNDVVETINNINVVKVTPINLYKPIIKNSITVTECPPSPKHYKPTTNNKLIERYEPYIYKPEQIKIMPAEEGTYIIQSKPIVACKQQGVMLNIYRPIKNLNLNTGISILELNCKYGSKLNDLYNNGYDKLYGLDYDMDNLSKGKATYPKLYDIGTFICNYPENIGDNIQNRINLLFCFDTILELPTNAKRKLYSWIKNNVDYFIIIEFNKKTVIRHDIEIELKIEDVITDLTKRLFSVADYFDSFYLSNHTTYVLKS